MTFYQELVVLHATSSMSDKFLVHAWRQDGGLNEEHSTSAYWGSTSFWHAKRCYNKFGPQCAKVDCSSFKFKHYLWACATSGKKLLRLYAKQPMANYRGPASQKVTLNQRITLLSLRWCISSLREKKPGSIWGWSGLPKEDEESGHENVGFFHSRP
jgi:hypothetical protein